MKTLIVATALTTMAAFPALADNTDQVTVSVSGTSVATLAATLDNSITMPDVVIPDFGGATGNTSVQMVCGGGSNTTTTVTYDSNGGNPFANGTSAGTTVDAASDNITPGDSGGTCAQITLAGESGFFYNVATAITVAGAGTGVTLTDARCYTNGGVYITGATKDVLTGGAAKLFCGGTVTLDNTATAQNYTLGAYTVDVTYD